MDTISLPPGSGTVASRSQILRCLIPRTSIPNVVVFRALSRMRAVPSSLRQLLFKWMVLTFDLVENRKHLQVMYDVIFQYLGYDDLRASVCQLLCYMTTRKHGKDHLQVGCQGERALY